MIGQGSGSGEKPVKILAAVFARGCYVEGRMKQIAIFNQNLVLSGKRYKRERELVTMDYRTTVLFSMTLNNP